METAMEEITSLAKVRIDTDEQIVNAWAVSAPRDDQAARVAWRSESDPHHSLRNIKYKSLKVVTSKRQDLDQDRHGPAD
eukprot:8341038-Pyramimonas_sp.AAC.1